MFYSSAKGLFFSREKFQTLVNSMIALATRGKKMKAGPAGRDALQYASELFITNVFKMAMLSTVYAGRETMLVQDMRLVGLDSLKAEMAEKAKKDKKDKKTKN